MARKKNVQSNNVTEQEMRKDNLRTTALNFALGTHERGILSAEDIINNAEKFYEFLNK